MVEFNVIGDSENILVQRGPGITDLRWAAARLKITAALGGPAFMDSVALKVADSPAPAIPSGDAPSAAIRKLAKPRRDKTAEQLAVHIRMGEGHISDLARMGRIPFAVKGTGTGKRIHRLFSVREILELREKEPGLFHISTAEREQLKQVKTA